ncbi:MAG: aminopeptidase [Lachnospiraceae bacterium]|nr:aminopeptidase [Lachnospiraceae bacterium]
MENKDLWNKYNSRKLSELNKLNDSYREFLSNCKTERECVDFFVDEAIKDGYVELSEAIKSGRKLKAGDKIYAVNMNKSIVMVKLGKKPLEEGVNILGAHIDSPRMDIKSNPLYEDGGIAYLDTHYYGGIKKYQWVTLPLAIHGVVCKKDGTTVIVNLGEETDDPVFFISDLLIHLSAKQMEKKASVVIEGEDLDVVIGSRPIADTKKKSAKDDEDKEEKEAVKKGVLKLLKDYYDMDEEDFLSAELEVVPAGRAYDAGIDRSMIMGYGHDDRVCSYPSFRAIMDTSAVERTAVCILTDKEEIGSVGATGMTSLFFENVMAEIVALATGKESQLTLRRMLTNSRMLSSDVNAGFDPKFASSFDKKNTSYLGKGMVLCKFTGSRGKSGSNDANAEYLAFLRKTFDDDDVQYQLAELGKVDLGGGGTIAYILAKYGMNVIDCGVAVLNMHAPFEVVSKADVYETYRGYVSFLKSV